MYFQLKFYSCVIVHSNWLTSELQANLSDTKMESRIDYGIFQRCAKSATDKFYQFSELLRLQLL